MGAIGNEGDKGAAWAIRFYLHLKRETSSSMISAPVSWREAAAALCAFQPPPPPALPLQSPSNTVDIADSSAARPDSCEPIAPQRASLSLSPLSYSSSPRAS